MSGWFYSWFKYFLFLVIWYLVCSIIYIHYYIVWMGPVQITLILSLSLWMDSTKFVQSEIYSVNYRCLFLQEKIMRIPYGAEKEYFKHSLFLVFCNRIMTSAVSAGSLLASIYITCMQKYSHVLQYLNCNTPFLNISYRQVKKHWTQWLPFISIPLCR